ncbi:MAG: hypothetical protein KF791_14695 [Verrucomicrobiae bacterium]|nr:hypothetical protein [Verrucomicrobiae bacterium]
MNTSELESLLRRAPQPAVPPGLRDRLVRQNPWHPGSGVPQRPEAAGDWLRRWWPTLLAGGGVLACAGVLIQQHGELQRLTSPMESLASPALPSAVSEGAAGVLETSVTAIALPDAGRQRQEIVELREERAALQATDLQATQRAMENLHLQEELTARSGLGPEDFAKLDAARERATSIGCVNNLKNVGLAIRVWAMEHDQTFPPDFLSASRELSSPKLLVCPSDPLHTTALDWATFSAAQISYEFLAPGSLEGERSAEALRVAARCPTHGNILLNDGSVQMARGDGSNIKDRLVHRDGALWYMAEPPPAPAPPAP